MQISDVFIVIPSFNEEQVLRQTLQTLIPYGYQLVVVDDGSAIPVVDRLKDLPVVCLRHPVNMGQGAALQTGMDYACSRGANFIVHFDADGQHQAHEIRNLLYPILRRETDVVFGSRFLDERSSSSVPFSRRLLLFFARILNFLYTGIWLSDAHNGFRAFSRLAAEKIRITQNGMAHASEILFLIRQQKLRLLEVPVTIHYSPYSKKKGQSGWNSLRIVFDLFFHKLIR